MENNLELGHVIVNITCILVKISEAQNLGD
jgi:hypothetical protein